MGAVERDRIQGDIALALIGCHRHRYWGSDTGIHHNVGYAVVSVDNVGEVWMQFASGKRSDDGCRVGIHRRRGNVCVPGVRGREGHVAVQAGAIAGAHVATGGSSRRINRDA